MKSVQEIATRIVNMYQFCQVNLFFSFLSKDPGLEGSLQELLATKEYGVNKVTMRNPLVASIIREEHNLTNGLGVIGQTAIQLCLTEIVSLYYEFSEKGSDFESSLKNALDKFVAGGASVNYDNFYSLICFIRLCFVHGKDFTMKTKNYSRWLKYQKDQSVQAVQLAVNASEYNLRIDIQLDRLVEGADIHDFIDLHQSQLLLEFLYQIADTIVQDSRK